MYFTWPIAENEAYPTIRHHLGGAGVPYAVDTYRPVLTDAADGSVKIVIVGLLTVLSKLLDSPATASIRAAT